MKKLQTIVLQGILIFIGFQTYAQQTLAWPAIQAENKAWTRWWWLGSSVTKAGISTEMEQYQKAGLGGLELTPIYGTIGDEANFIEYLSPQWIDMLEHTLAEAKRLNLGIDMATGTGWPFGGPWVNDADACKYMAHQVYQLKQGEQLKEAIVFQQKPVLRTVSNGAYPKYAQQNLPPAKLPPWVAQKRPLNISDLTEPIKNNPHLQAMAIDQVRFPKSLPLQTLVAYSDQNKIKDLSSKVDAQGKLHWKAPRGNWTLYAIFQGDHGKLVERAAPGGEGNVIDHFSASAIQHYLARFDQAFANRKMEGLRAYFNDSYEVDDAAGQADWTPALFAEFEKRRGYDLRKQLPALFGRDEPDKNLRVLSDYRQTVSDLILATFTSEWSQWAKSKGAIIRNQGHGSPANILDLYALSDIPETEGIDIIKIKFASSAAHIAGRKLASAEAATWLNEHFRSSLADLKENLDRYFLGGVNHVLYHGTAYSPPNEPWPGQLFYAAVHVNPRNSFWGDFSALNQYVARTQSLLQNSQPDNELLVYFPIFDAYAHSRTEMLQHFDGGRKGMEGMTLKAIADTLQEKGYTFDFISDQQILALECKDGKLHSAGSNHRAILIPECRFMPLEVMEKLLELARNGATILWHKNLPGTVPGYGDFDKRQEKFKQLIAQVEAEKQRQNSRIFKHNSLVALLSQGSISREQLVDLGLEFTRRHHDQGQLYFVSNWSQSDVDAWVPLNAAGKNIAILDPMTGKMGIAATRQVANGQQEVHLQLVHGSSYILQIFEGPLNAGAWNYLDVTNQVIPLDGEWQICMLKGGPIPADSCTSTQLGSWTNLKGAQWKSFSGTARYSLNFPKPQGNARAWLLDLGKVAESARVRLNGQEIAVLIGPRFSTTIDAALLRDNNLLEIEVSNSMANRIADLDRQGLRWKKFYNANFPARLNQNRGEDGLFDASKWEASDSGLLGPVALKGLR